MREEGPVPPLLLTGHPGLGKSTLLAKWYTDTCIHFTCMCIRSFTNTALGILHFQLNVAEENVQWLV